MDPAWLYCAVRIRGGLSPAECRDWFGELEFSQQADGGILLTGQVADQSAVFGILWKICDLKLALISLEVRDECFDFNR